MAKAAKKTKRILKAREFCNGTKTQAEFFSGFRSYLRRLWMWSCPERKKALAKIKTGKKYYCHICQKLHIKKNIEINHIEPVGSLKTFADIEVFYERLFVSADKLEAICKDCHGDITHNRN